MKRIIFSLIILGLLSGCVNKQDDLVDNNEDIENKEEVLEEEDIIEYIDENPIKLAFYDGGSSLRFLVNSYNGKWIRGSDITWLNVFPTNKNNLSGSVKTLWQEYWQEFVNQSYKFGLEISYSLNNGEKKDLTILKPSNNIGFDYVEIYIYDGYNATTSWIDHLEDNEINNDTVITSVKLTSGKYIDEVISPITLKVFTYDSEDDFDEVGKYRGNSYNVVIVNKE